MKDTIPSEYDLAYEAGYAQGLAVEKQREADQRERRTARRLRNLVLFVVTAGFIAFCVFVVVTAPKR